MLYLQLTKYLGYLWNMNEMEKSVLKEKGNNLLNLFPSNSNITFLGEFLYLQVFLHEYKILYGKEKNIKVG